MNQQFHEMTVRSNLNLDIIKTTQNGSKLMRICQKSIKNDKKYENLGLREGLAGISGKLECAPKKGVKAV